MKHAIILGIGSDIGREIARRLGDDPAWSAAGYKHDEVACPESWDLIVCCYGTLEPIGSIWDVPMMDFHTSVCANALLPLGHVKALYPQRRPGASVCFFSGAGTGGPAPSYAAYAASKVMLVKLIELMDDESPDCKFFILGPGMVRTKIHQQTMTAGGRAHNFNRVSDFVLSTQNVGTSHDDIYACLMACVVAPKEIVGGRNICVHLDDWSRLRELAMTPDRFKLRRHEAF
jgi:NAD(P)-dependent dehydrogenase (short-subunit alcohol dehydrogenase family)